jgi:hypothetical protein
VDDGLFVASSPTLLASLRNLLNGVLDLKWDKQLSSIVGLRVCEVDAGFVVDQPILVQKILSLTPSAIKTRTPIALTKLVSQPSSDTDKDYFTARKSDLDGCIQVYIACGHPIQTRARATE